MNQSKMFKEENEENVSYLANAFQLAGLPSDTEPTCKFDINTHIMSLNKKITDDSRSPKFLIIASLFKIVASFSHGNSAPENGFSTNKYLI